MCKLCDRIKKEVEGTTELLDSQKQEFMKEIAKYMKKFNVDSEHFDPVMDILLDNTMLERDTELEEVYEHRLKD